MLTWADLLIKHTIKYDPKQYRLRCQGHIINLSVNSFLFVTDDESLENEEDTGTTKATLKEIEEWRRFGPLGMLHNIVVFIQASPQRMHNFLLFSHDRRPARDNKTRWNSWEKILRICTKAPVYTGILAYFEHYLEDEIKLDELLPDDWNTLRKIHAFLEEIKETTKALESDNSTLEKVLPAMDFILERFEQAKDEYKDDSIMAPMFNSSWAKIEKYYTLTEESPAYITALVLRPSYKWNYITKQ